MKKNKQLKPLRVDDDLYKLINKALQILNQNKADIKITQAQFRRWAYQSFSQKILSEGLSLDFKPKGIQ